MQAFDRRTALAYSAIALSGPARDPVAFAASDPAALIKATPTITNPLACRTYISTVVTPDMDASIGFYCDLMDHEVIGRGKLEGKLPTVRGVGAAGRRYALLKVKKLADPERGIVRLLEAPAGAAANRPRPQTAFQDVGMIAMETMTRDARESHAKLTKAGVKAVSEPLPYYRPALKPLPGSQDQFAQTFEIYTYSVFGLAGEQMFVSQGISRGGQPYPTWTQPNLHGAMGGAVFVNRDRWPVWHFYKNAFGLLPTKDQYSYHQHKDWDVENINILLGLPAGTYYRFGGLGDGVGLEWYEFRQWEPPAAPPFPTDLDRTGYAMVTFIVDDLARVRQNLTDAQIVAIGEGALPVPDRKAGDGLYLRGPVGELIEVIDRGT